MTVLAGRDEERLPRAVLAIAALAVLVLLLLAPAYGFHRDELYFVIAGRHPAWGYVDQPPLTPVMSALGVALLGVTPIAIRLLPALTFGLVVVIGADMARVMGGDRRATVVAAACLAGSGLLLGGHLASTATYDILAWTLISWLVARILGGGDPRLWLAVGVVSGIGLLNKSTLPLLPATLAAGLVIERRWSVFRSPWPWAGAALALVIAAPNLAWQVANGFPQAQMARSIAAATGAENRAMLLPLQAVLAGPFLVPVMLAGLWRLLRRPAARPWRCIAWAYLLAMALTLWQAGKSYYVAGFIPVLYAAGAVAASGWLARGRSRLRLGVLAAAWLATAVVVAVLALPVLPRESLRPSGVNAINGEQGEQVGWPELVRTVEHVVTALPPEDRAHAAIIATNYAEAGALELLGTGLPPVYSGHNSYWDFGRPSDDVTTVVIVGDDSGWGLPGCRIVARIDNGIDLDNEEQGRPIAVCRGPAEPWQEVWPRYRHVG